MQLPFNIFRSSFSVVHTLQNTDLKDHSNISSMCQKLKAAFLRLPKVYLNRGSGLPWGSEWNLIFLLPLIVLQTEALLL